MKVLLLEDDIESQAFLKRVLKPLCTEILLAASIAEGRAQLAGPALPDLLLLDMTLPDGTGFQFCESLAADDRLRAIPFMIVSGDDKIETKMAAFSLGAEDYIVKPFNSMELRARLESRLKKIAAAKQGATKLTRGALEIDVAKQLIFAGAEKRLVRLTPREFRILACLAEREDYVITRTQLLDSVWGNDAEVFDRTVDTHVSAIRKKLGEYGAYIEAVPGSGYRFSSAALAKKPAA